MFVFRCVLNKGTKESAFKGSPVNTCNQEFLGSYVLKLAGKSSSMSWFIINSEFKGGVLTEENVHGSTAWVKKDHFSQIIKILGTIDWCMLGYTFTARRLINFHLYRNSFAWA